MSVKLYADDIELYACYDVPLLVLICLLLLVGLFEWSVTWQLSTAIQKCFAGACSLRNNRSNAVLNHKDIPIS